MKNSLNLRKIAVLSLLLGVFNVIEASDKSKMTGIFAIFNTNIQASQARKQLKQRPISDDVYSNNLYSLLKISRVAQKARKIAQENADLASLIRTELVRSKAARED